MTNNTTRFALPPRSKKTILKLGLQPSPNR